MYCIIYLSYIVTGCIPPTALFINIIISMLYILCQEFDTNKDGCISHKEFKNALESQKLYAA